MTESDRPRIIAPAPVFYVVAFALLLALHWCWPLSLVDHPATAWVGRAILFPGLALNLWGVFSMKRNGTPINPYKSTRRIVSSSAFRVSRNPLYVGLDLILLGLALILDSFWGILILPVLLIIMHFGVILPEERYLEGKFGGTYSQYRAAVRRYL